MTTDITYIAIVIFIASLARSTLGFGDGLLAMPLLTLTLAPRFAAPLVALCATTTAAIVLVRQWKQVHFHSATRLILTGFLAIPCGVWFLHFGNEDVTKAILGSVLLVFATWSLRRTRTWQLSHDRWSPAFGFTAGILSGAYNTGGPPIVVYGTLRGWPPEQFRATLQSYTLLSSTWVVLMHAISGLITQRVLSAYLTCVPVVAVACIVGPKLSHRLSIEHFTRVVFWALVLIGTWLLISSVSELTRN